MKYVYIHGSYFGNNYGDVLLVDLFAKRIRDLGYSPVFPFASKFYFEQTGVDIGIKDKNQVLAGIFCGGGYLGEPSYKKLKWSIRNYFRHAPAYKMYNKNFEYGVFGTGFGPITYNPFKKLATNIIKNSKVAVVRDNKSKSYISEYLGEESNRVSVAADVVISLNKNDLPQNAIDAVNEKYSELFKKEILIGVHVTDKFTNKDTFQYIAEALVKVKEKIPNAFFVFLSDGKSRLNRKLQQTSDAEYLSSKLGGERCIHYPYENHWEMTYFLSKLNLVITSKLHVGIVSTAMGVSVASIPYHSKTIRYYSQVNAKDRCLTEVNSSNDVFEHILRNLYKNAIDVPDVVIDSSKGVFLELSTFLSNLIKET